MTFVYMDEYVTSLVRRLIYNISTIFFNFKIFLLIFKIFLNQKSPLLTRSKVAENNQRIYYINIPINFTIFHTYIYIQGGSNVGGQ